MSDNASGDTIVIKKYANRRLYDTSASRYVTLDHLRDLVSEGRNFKVVDAKSGEDLTRTVLAQIILEEESKGETLLPVEFLRQLISFYGDSMQSMVPGYLRMSMESFAQQQEEMRRAMTGAMGAGAGNPVQMMEEITKQNMAMFEQGMKMFSPFGAATGTGASDTANTSNEVDDNGEDVSDLRAELDAMRKRLDKLAGDN